VSDLGLIQLKNIAEQVHVYSLDVGQPAEPKPASPPPGKPAPPLLSLVVLPFANIGGHPEQDYFAHGVTESLTSDLSHISSAFVIARNTAFTFKGIVGDGVNIAAWLERICEPAGTRRRRHSISASWTHGAVILIAIHQSHGANGGFGRSYIQPCAHVERKA
jgi:hypothetical protein